MRKNRIESIDFLRGLVMIIMALDHVRDYFFFGSFTSNPSDLSTTTPLLFYTRIITHYCAPVFILLTGTSAYLYGAKKNKRDLSKFLFTRGVWLIFLEIVIFCVVVCPHQPSLTFKELNVSLNRSYVFWGR